MSDGLWDQLVHDDRHGPLPLALLAMTVVTGLVDAVSFLALGRVFVGNMTGNVVFVAFGLAGAPGFSAVSSLIALAAFLAGGWCAGALAVRVRTNRARILAGAAGVEVVTTVVATVIVGLAGDHPGTGWRDVAVLLLALGLGSRNGLVRHLAVPDLTTTVLTTTLTGLAFDVHQPDVGWRGVRLRVLSVVSMFAGGAVGATLLLQVAAWVALAAAAGIAAGVAYSVLRLSAGGAPWMRGG